MNLNFKENQNQKNIDVEPQANIEQPLPKPHENKFNIFCEDHSSFKKDIFCLVDGLFFCSNEIEAHIGHPILPPSKLQSLSEEYGSLSFFKKLSDSFKLMVDEFFKFQNIINMEYEAIASSCKEIPKNIEASEESLTKLFDGIQVEGLPKAKKKIKKSPKKLKKSLNTFNKKLNEVIKDVMEPLIKKKKKN